MDRSEEEEAVLLNIILMKSQMLASSEGMIIQGHQPQLGLQTKKHQMLFFLPFGKAQGFSCFMLQMTCREA